MVMTHKESKRSRSFLLVFQVRSVGRVEDSLSKGPEAQHGRYCQKPQCSMQMFFCEEVDLVLIACFIVNHQNLIHWLDELLPLTDQDIP